MTEEKDTKEEVNDVLAEETAAAEAEISPETVVVATPKTVLDEIIVETEQAVAKRGKGKFEFSPIKKEEIKAGMIIRVHQKIIDVNAKGEEKERVQVFQGMVLARKHGTEAGATILVRKVSEGVGVEKIFPLALPSITKLELVRKFQIRQARPYFLRNYKKKLREIKVK